MSKNSKKKTVRINPNNPALMFIDGDLYKYFEGVVSTDNMNAYEGAKDVVSEIKDRIEQIENTSRVRTNFVLNVIFEKLPNKGNKLENFENHTHTLNVRNIGVEFDNVKKTLGKLRKRVKTLETEKDFCTKYRITIICCKKYI